MLSTKLKSKILRMSFDLLFAEQMKKRHYTFLVRRNKVITIGQNSKTSTHPLALYYNYEYFYIHSELDVIRKLPKLSDLPKLKVFNVRVNRVGETHLARPCKYCRNMLSLLGVKEVIYSIQNHKFKVCYL